MVCTRLLTGAFVAATAAAHAQSPAPPAASGAGTNLQYESAFAGYRPFTEVEILSWQRANGDAAMLGGHMGQMKHDAMPAMAPGAKPPATSPAKTPAPASPGPAAQPQ